MIPLRINERPLNRQALALEEAEGRIRLAVKDAYLKRTPFEKLKEKVRRIIDEALERITIPDLKDAARRSLTAFFTKTARTAGSIGKRDLITFLALTKLIDLEGGTKSEYGSAISAAEAKRVVRASFPDIPDATANNYGMALNTYHKTYMEERIAPVMDRLAKEQALDPDSPEYIEQRQSLRARAEREVRYDWQQSSYQEMIDKGVKLVIISSHANCSERCAPFQGKVYSLDGSSGTTEDGRKYEPLEKATDIFVTTKSGRVWKNGLFGFNCRHYMVEYKPGFRFPKVSEAEEKKQYAIDRRQRELERRVITYKVRAEMAKGVDKTEYKKARAKAKYWDQYYRSFSKKNGRAFFDSRTKTI